jgi:hypothetical protein
MVLLNLATAQTAMNAYEQLIADKVKEIIAELTAERLDVTAPTVTIQLMRVIFPETFQDGEIPVGPMESHLRFWGLFDELLPVVEQYLAEKR